MPVQILSTKLTIPPLRSRLVRRNRLIQKLNQGLEYGLVLVSAPAGYGKSTLLSDWLSQVEIATTWLTLDNNDNDPPRFLAYLAAALAKIDPSIGDVFNSKQNFRNLPEVELQLIPLINQVSHLKHPFYLILDDFHLIQDQTVHQVVNFLVGHRPTSLHLVIATRADPPLPLANLRARSEMLELRLADLRFTTRETGDFLTRTMELQVSPTDVASITSRTEGWIAGLQIAALSMQNMDDVSGFIASLAGTDYYIFDYLMKEILTHQSSEIRQFLLYTSILDQFTAPLCDAMLSMNVDAAPTRSSADILTELEHANLFLVPLDPLHQWFRYHHLFSDLLRLMLEQTNTEVSVELHRRACRWYEAQGMVPEALQHAISSGDMQLVAQIVSANVLVLVENDEVMPTLQKISLLLPDEITALPWLGIARAWVLGVGDVHTSLQILDDVEKSIENAPDNEERQRLKGHIAAARAFVFCALGDTTNTIAHARIANELLPADEIAARAMNLTRWGDILIDKQNDLNAIPILEQALALARQAKKPHVAMIASAALASANHHAGRLHELHRICLDALTIEEDYQRRYHRPLSATAEIYSLLARVLAEWGEDEKAILYARKGLMLSERWGEMVTETLCLCYLGRILVFRNDWEQACQLFHRADSAAQKISTWFWHAIKIYALDSLLDSESADNNEITNQIDCLQESGAHISSLLTARLLLRSNQPNQALVALEQALADLKGQPSYDTVRIYALCALAYQSKRDEKQAQAYLQQALDLGEPENRVASFVREGAAMEKLLKLAHTKGISPQFVSRLLAAFEARRKPRLEPALLTDRLVEPLSERELQVLKLLGQGYTDKQIASTLIVTSQTIHQHLKNIYSKLDVHSRSEAIVRAQKLGLL
jgi:LuxR family transcriptional regulator, maltose regulon positive regulatory protein